MYQLIKHSLEKVDSTQTWARKQLPEICDQELHCITAQEQTVGYGRRKTPWISPKNKNLYVTFAFRSFDVDPQLVPLALALITCKILEELGINPKIKWPNDILLGGRKLAGIICEVSIEGIVYLGIGLNVLMDKKSLDRVDQPATSLCSHIPSLPTIDQIQDHLIQKWKEALELYRKEGFTPFQAQVLERMPSAIH